MKLAHLAVFLFADGWHSDNRAGSGFDATLPEESHGRGNRQFPFALGKGPCMLMVGRPMADLGPKALSRGES